MRKKKNGRVGRKKSMTAKEFADWADKQSGLSQKAKATIRARQAILHRLGEKIVAGRLETGEDIVADLAGM